MAYDLAVILCFIGASFVFGFIALNVNGKRHAVLQFLFLSACLFFVTDSFYTTSKIAEINNQTALQDLSINAFSVSMWVAIVFLLYMIILFIQEILTWLAYRKTPKIERE